MKWSIFGLLVFGVVAAICAAVLVASLRVSARPRNDTSDVEFLVAAKALPRSKILDPDSIAERTLPRKDAPEGCISNAVQVIGKVLAVPMVEGQPFTKSCFASENSGYRVASVLPEGMRAVTLSLFDHAGLQGLLYAGCTVDILTSFKLPGRECEALSTPLLQGVQVLAVEGETLVSTQQSPEGKKTSEGNLKKLLVTVMVDVEQASALQLATQYGSVSLALRNPMDKNAVPRKSSFLSQFTKENLPSLAPLKDWAASIGNALKESSLRANTAEGRKEPEKAPAAETMWKVTLIKAGVQTTQAVPLQAAGEREMDVSRK